MVAALDGGGGGACALDPAAHLGSASGRRIWKAFCLQPHSAKSFRLSTDPLFVEKVRDIAGLYMAPPVEIQYLDGNAAVGGGAIINSPFGPGWAVIGVGDFNHDGKADLVYRNAASGVTEVQFLNGTTPIGGGIVAFGGGFVAFG